MSIARTAPFMSRPAARHPAMENDIALRSFRAPSARAAALARCLNSFPILSRPWTKSFISCSRRKRLHCPNLPYGMQRP
jgi:hypothetical protein